jgi:predicted nucleic acid-binding protein
LSIYADSSFLVSLYVTDQHSSLSRQRVLTAPGLWLTPLHRAEWAHAIGQHVFRGILSSSQANQLHHQLEDDESTGVWVQVGIPENALEVCADLGRRYGPKLGIRTLDSLHVAVALELQAGGFWTFDDRQLKLAKAVGLRQHRH